MARSPATRDTVRVNREWACVALVELTGDLVRLSLNENPRDRCLARKTPSRILSGKSATARPRCVRGSPAPSPLEPRSTPTRSWSAPVRPPYSKRHVSSALGKSCIRDLRASGIRSRLDRRESQVCSTSTHSVSLPPKTPALHCCATRTILPAVDGRPWRYRAAMTSHWFWTRSTVSSATTAPTRSPCLAPDLRGRVGHPITDPRLIARLRAPFLPLLVGNVAQAAALRAEAEKWQSVTRNCAERDALRTALRELGWSVPRSHTNLK